MFEATVIDNPECCIPGMVLLEEMHHTPEDAGPMVWQITREGLVGKNQRFRCEYRIFPEFSYQWWDLRSGVEEPYLMHTRLVNRHEPPPPPPYSDPRQLELPLEGENRIPCGPPLEDAFRAAKGLWRQLPPAMQARILPWGEMITDLLLFFRHTGEAGLALYDQSPQLTVMLSCVLHQQGWDTLRGRQFLQHLQDPPVSLMPFAFLPADPKALEALENVAFEDFTGLNFLWSLLREKWGIQEARAHILKNIPIHYAHLSPLLRLDQYAYYFTPAFTRELSEKKVLTRRERANLEQLHAMIPEYFKGGANRSFNRIRSFEVMEKVWPFVYDTLARDARLSNFGQVIPESFLVTASDFARHLDRLDKILEACRRFHVNFLDYLSDIYAGKTVLYVAEKPEPMLLIVHKMFFTVLYTPYIIPLEQAQEDVSPLAREKARGWKSSCRLRADSLRS